MAKERTYERRKAEQERQQTESVVSFDELIKG
jgi:hypothetical protein